jgi:hypothetical protein
LASHRSPEVASAAVASLSKVGRGGSVDELIASLEKRKGKVDLAFQIQTLDALGATGTDQALDAVLRFAQGSDPELRAASMGSLALFHGNSRAVEALAKGLEDSDANVRSSTMRALKHVRDKAVISPLIDLLGKEKEERLKVDAVQLLVGLTNQNMGLVAEDWKKWWGVTRDHFEVPKEGSARTAGTAVKVHDLSYFGIEVSSRRISFLIDVSGSMLETVPFKYDPKKASEDTPPASARTAVVARGGKAAEIVKGGKAKKIDILKLELPRLLRKLPPDTQINIMTGPGHPVRRGPQDAARYECLRHARGRAEGQARRHDLPAHRWPANGGKAQGHAVDRQGDRRSQQNARRDHPLRGLWRGVAPPEGACGPEWRPIPVREQLRKLTFAPGPWRPLIP